MTLPLAVEADRRRRIRAKRERKTGAGDLAGALRAMLLTLAALTWPNPKYQEDPVGFFQDVLGVEPWEKQVEIIEAIRDHPRVAVKAGRKISKSHTAAGAALWYFCTFPDAQVIMSSVTARQVDDILWRELSMMRARSGRCLSCKKADPSGRKIPAPCPHSALIDGELHKLARSGLGSEDFRVIKGYTAKQREALQGTSGTNLLYIVDEASGVDDAIFEAIEGNAAGGARLVLFGNPTKTSGTFYEAFTSKKEFWHGITVSSEETPNAISGENLIPGLATFDWIERMKAMHGEDSPFYLVHVRGEFAIGEDGKIFSIHKIQMGQERWKDAKGKGEGRLFIGLDPAGASGTGDEIVFTVRRGLVCERQYVFRGLTIEEHRVHLLSILRTHTEDGEVPVVVLDREGNIGAEVMGNLRSYLAINPRAFELVTVRASSVSTIDPLNFHLMRDGLVHNLDVWLREGGAIPEDHKLEQELHIFEYISGPRGRAKVTKKDAIRKELGRSPDRFDSLALACYEPSRVREGLPTRPIEDPSIYDRPTHTFDPYAARDTWG